MTAYIIGGLVGLVFLLLAAFAFMINNERREMQFQQKQYEKELKKAKEEEVKKNEIKETLNTGNQHDNVRASLDLLQNNKKQKAGK